MYNFNQFAGIAQLVERNLAKVEVASSSLVSRSKSEKQCQRLFDKKEAYASFFLPWSVIYPAGM
jgi:hypothetical protein